MLNSRKDQVLSKAGEWDFSWIISEELNRNEMNMSYITHQKVLILLKKKWIYPTGG